MPTNGDLYSPYLPKVLPFYRINTTPYSISLSCNDKLLEGGTFLTVASGNFRVARKLEKSYSAVQFHK